MKKKIRLGILFGGRSGEHEVSLLSAASILKAIDRRKYEVVPIGITKDGQWLTGGEAQHLLSGEAAPTAPQLVSPDEDDPGFASVAAVLRSGEPISIPPSAPAPARLHLNAAADLALAEKTSALGLDLIFPVLHGTFGEDGTIQGLLEVAGIAYVGSGVLGSAAGMDKDVMKRLFRSAGLPQTPWVTLLRSEWKSDPLRCRKLIEKSLAYPLFVKPANLGSSVGISKVHDRKELATAMDLASQYDRKLVIEQGVGGPGAKPRELEVAVLGNDEPEASVIGEIVPNREFYDYDSKYADSAEPSIPIIPAKLSASEQKQIRTLAVAAFKACDAAGLARVDFLMEPPQRGRKPAIFLNEINTMPGFTSISMYPKLWQASGLGYRQLIDRLIQLAQQRQAEKLNTSFQKM
ncbi:D-alanine--D-alanine ligase [Granulicella sp. WH15]|uniref:D-alanine--D-alanine ligase family protein n=1 Tax=Granulicella sp. WH15 TaxID=2602070 RepID=UPI0013676422|nr:D-alanine--D-alanine ligase family protein [Granulicella sp. WH15]QHN02296.1 D-alanine--D-alanine ligase [Granulicella sp. WH15]